MHSLRKVVISLAVSLAYGSRDRPVEWLFAISKETGSRYYIEPKERVAELRTRFTTTMDDGFQCISATQYSTISDMFPVRYAWINRVEDKTMKQTRYSASLVANETEDCFTSLSPPDPEVVADLNRICENHDFWITTSSDPMHIEDGTYSGEKADSMKLEVDVKDGRAERVTARPKNEGAKTMKKLTYFKVGDVLSVTMENPAASLIRDKMILEPNTRDAQFEHGVGRSNLKDWDRETASAANMERGKGKAAKGGLKGLKKLARKLTRREKHRPTLFGVIRDVTAEKLR
ncbi:hypothetical protein FOZ60_010469 [Perkinsus olseni]|uniref:Uncharacterized protein n=1 Tax=Perkinsus olseni TaxID=32597 RepID=A0A7J6NF67_PEROL|nr:hypothetical protein FOZ60_010469 [Perkinsus olseni]